MSDDKQLGYWIEWKQRCALGLCGQDARQSMTSFVANHMTSQLHDESFRFGLGDEWTPDLSVNQCWHYFEVHFVTKQNKHGKRYKDWLFARTATSNDAPLKVILGGVKNLLRDVSREYLRKERGRKGQISLDEPVGASDDHGPSRLDVWLVDSATPSDAAVHNDDLRWAAVHANNVFRSMSRRLKIAVMARACETALSNPTILALAQCGKSVITDCHTKWIASLAESVKAACPKESRDTQRQLVLCVILEIQRLALAWASTETDCAEFLSSIETSSSQDSRP